MRATAHLAVGWDGTSAYLAEVRTEAPFSIRQVGRRFVFVSSAAAPVRGDELQVTVELAPGAVAEIGTVAAMIVWPGPDGPPSRTMTHITVGAGGHLDWLPEPTVSVAGSDHVARTVVELGEGATCTIVEEYALGRHAEPCGTLVTELRVERGGRPLVHHGERFGPGSPRHVIAAVATGRTGEPRIVVDVERGVYAATMPAAVPDTWLTLATGPDRPTLLPYLQQVAGAPVVQPTGGYTAIAARTSASDASPPSPVPVMRPDSST